MPGPALGEDLRDRYGTRSMQAARLFQAGLELMEAKQIPQALRSFEKAYAVDRDFDLALYWIAIASGGLGDVERAVQTFAQVVEQGRRSGRTSVATEACVDVALLHAKIDDEEKAIHWFSQAILLDPQDEHQLAWKAYRNMAISHHEKEQPLSAAICAANAFEANPRIVEESMVADMLSGVRNEEVGVAISLPKSGGSLPPRKEPVETSPLKVEGIDEHIQDIQLDPVQNRVFAFGATLSHYYRIEDKAAAKAVRVPAGGKVVSACANGGNLYLVLQSPPSLVQVDPVSGEQKKRWPLPSAPQSIAVYPIQNLAFFPINGFIHQLNLANSQLRPSKMMATGIRPDPQQRFCFTYIHGRAKGHVIVDDRPVLLHGPLLPWRQVQDASQTALFRYVLAENGMLIASFRLHAASNGHLLHVSPDGRWVAVVGEGGWRPNDPQHGAGHGVAVFKADDLSRVQGFFETNANPQGAAIHPTTGLIAVFNEKQGRLFDLASSKQLHQFEGPFGRASSWDATGRSLYVAGRGRGVIGLQVRRSADEKKKAETWVAALKAAWPQSERRTEAVLAKPVEGLGRFKVKNSKPGLLSLIKKATQSGQTKKPIDYLHYPAYTSGATSRDQLVQALNLSRSDEPGIAIFKIKKWLAADKKHPVLIHLLGLACYRTGQLDLAFIHQVNVIREDQGKTNVTIEALRNLAYLSKKRGKPLEGAYCFAMVLYLDKLNPEYAEEGSRFFEDAGVLKEAKTLLAASSRMAYAGENTPKPQGLPQLLRPQPGAEMTPEKLFTSAVPSVVLIKTPSGSGSGVCIARGVLLTNHHVIGGERDSITVHPYALTDGVPQRLAAQSAQVMYLNETRDIALLSIPKPPKSLKPLPVATQNPPIGQRVYALGSPGLGPDVLEQSITDGIVSAVDRRLEGVPFLQHTAALNPGSSGGPLLNSQGHIIGINTTKTSLAGVSFAIPAPEVRTLLD